MGVNPYGNPKSSCKAKVGDLDRAILVYKEISRLEVSVQDSSGMAENNALKRIDLEILKKLNSISH